MFVAITQFQEAFVNLVTITFTTLICVEMLNVLSEVTQIRCMMIVSIFITMGIYMGSIIIFRQYFELSYVDWNFCVKVGLLSLICWLPLQAFRKFMEHIDPTQEEKIMKEDI
jgi:phospholipid-translocating ATPase